MSLSLDLFASSQAKSFLKEKLKELVELGGKELFVENFDEEQIWSQIQSRKLRIPKFKTDFDLIAPQVQVQEEEQEEDADDMDDMYGDQDDFQDDYEQNEPEETFDAPQDRTSGTEDIQTFIQNMETILDQEEEIDEELEAEGDDDEANLELYAEDKDDLQVDESDEEGLEKYLNAVKEHYKDDLAEESEDEDEGFFDVNGKLIYKNQELSKKEEKEFLNEVDMQEKKLLKQMEELEDDTLKEKEWKFTGEVTSFKRPKGSLLEEDVAFNHTGKAKPVITEEVTQNLEEMILHRIISGIFDDPKRVQEDQVAKKQKELDHEKSKQSLAEMYQQEYEKRVSGSMNIAPVEEKHILEAKNKVRGVVTKLLHTLNRLSNLHFVPEPTVNATVVNKVEDAMISLVTETPEEIMKPIPSIKEEIKYAKKTKSALTQDKEKRVHYTKSTEFFKNLEDQKK